MILLKLVIKVIAFVLFCFISAYVAVVGKGRTGIKIDYLITSILLCLLMFRI